MSESTELRFRTAVGGFHKGDVTDYITKTAARHKDELSALEQENKRLQTQLEETTKQLEILQLLLAGSPAQPEQPPVSKTEAESTDDTITSLELAAYRRAEHAERIANNRARQLYQQLDQIGQESQVSLSTARDATEQVLSNLNEFLMQLQGPYQALVDQLSTASSRLAAITDMNPDPAEGMEGSHE